MVWYSHFFQNFSTVYCDPHSQRIWHSQWSWSRYSSGIPWLYDPVNVGNLISGSSAFSKTSLNIWEFTVHVLLKPGLENFEHYFTSVWDKCNCVVVWAFFGIAFLWDWNENWPFPVLWLLLSFPNLLTYWVQHLITSSFRILNSSAGIPGEGNGTPLQYSCLENRMDGGAWKAAVHGVAEGRTQLSDFTFTFIHWRPKWQPTPVFLPGESQGRGSLVSCHLWGRTELDTTKTT